MKLFTEPDPRLPSDCGIVAFCTLLGLRYRLTVDYNGAAELMEERNIYDPERGSSDRKLASLVREFTGCRNYYRNTRPIPLSKFVASRPDWTGLVTTHVGSEGYHISPVLRGKQFNAVDHHPVVATMGFSKFDCVKWSIQFEIAQRLVTTP
jgi:hypothetical protein